MQLWEVINLFFRLFGIDQVFYIEHEVAFKIRNKYSKDLYACI